MIRDQRRADIAIMAVFALLAAIVPWVAASHLSTRIARDLEPALSRALGEQVSIAGVQAGVTGEVRVRDIRVGRMFSAASIEASVALSSLLSGHLDADEIRVKEPRILARVHADGSSNLGRLVQHALRRRAGRVSTTATASARVAARRRIVVTGGDLVVDINGQGRLRLSNVTLTPHRSGLRAVAGATELHARRGPYAVRARVERLAADLTLPGLRVPRFLAVAGTIEVQTAGQDATAPLVFERVSMSRGIGRDDLAIHGHIADPGALPAAMSARLRRDDGAANLHVEMSHLPLAILAPLMPSSVDLSQARAHGHMALAHAPGRTTIDLDADISALVIDHRSVAQSAIEVSGHTRLRARASDARMVANNTGQTARQIDIDELTLTTGALTVAIDGQARYAPGARSWLPHSGELGLRVPTLPCAAALGALPEGLRKTLMGLDLAGTFGARARLLFARAHPEATELDLDLDASACRVLRDAVAADPARLKAPFEHTPAGGDRALIGKGQPGYARLKTLPRHLSHAFLSAEDARFYRHRGFDTRQIERSLAIDLRDGKFVRGGSTISQQLVKNVYLSHRRTLARKLQEAVLTWRLEAVLDKDTILERYLNIIELGPGVFGISAAAQHWFGKSPARLSVRESAFLAALTRAPRTMSRRIAMTRGVDPATERRIDAVLASMRKNRVISASALARARAERLTLRPDFIALH